MLKPLYSHFYQIIRSQKQLDLKMVEEHLFNEPCILFDKLRGSLFARGLPWVDAIQSKDVATIFKAMIINNSVEPSEFPEKLLRRSPQMDGSMKKGPSMIGRA